MPTRWATASMAAALDAVKVLLNSGSSAANVTIYSGTQPATPETALSGNTALVTFVFSATAFGSDSLSSGNEVATASFVSSSVSPSNSGTATFARVVNGATVVGDFTVGTSGTDIVLGSTTISTGVPVNLTSFQFQAGPAA